MSTQEYDDDDQGPTGICLEFNDFDFLAYYDGKLTDEEKAILQAHVKGCQHCTIRFNDWRILLAKLEKPPDEPKQESSFADKKQDRKWREDIIRDALATFFNTELWNYKQKELMNMLQHQFMADAKDDLARIQEISVMLQKEVKRLNESKNNPCPYWKDSDFFRFWIGQMDTQEAECHHWNNCKLCYVHFLLCTRFLWHVQAGTRTQWESAYQHLYKELQSLKRQLQELQQLAQIQQSKITDATGRGVEKPIDNNNNQAVLSDNRKDDIMLATACPSPLIPRYNAYLPDRQTLKLAALLLLVLLPLVAVGLMFIKIPNNNTASIPLQRSDQDNKITSGSATIEEMEALVRVRDFNTVQPLLDAALAKARTSGDKVSQAKLLYLQGRLFSAKADFNNAIVTLEQAIAIATPLNNPELLLRPYMMLANIYHVTDSNKEARDYAQKALYIARLTNNVMYQVANLQMLGISEFFLSKSLLAEQYIQQAIDLAAGQPTEQTREYTIQNYNYLGIIYTEQKRFAQAYAFFNKALVTCNDIKDQNRQSYMRAISNGYYARTFALAGNYSQAADLYIKALALAEAANVRQNLALSQFHQGLGDCLKAQGKKAEADAELIIAQKLEKQAQEHCERVNLFLSFAPTRKASPGCY
ncbi:MAG: zf-HC2 domain-containing protein [Acidobacteriota bacterium]